MKTAEVKLIALVEEYKKVTKVTMKFATSAYVAQQMEYVCVCVCLST
jgi:hypothetical protein